MAERPLLILPMPGAPGSRAKKHGGSGRMHAPGRARQGERLGPRFAALQQALDTRRVQLQAEAARLVPEEVVVLETAGPVERFVVAVSKVDGLEWLGEVEAESIPPDDDFFAKSEEGEKQNKDLRGRLFLVFTNQQALKQILSLWDQWQAGRALVRGLRKWGNVFALLRDVRPWGIRDRLGSA